MLRWHALSPNHFTSGRGVNQVLCAILAWPATPALIPNSFRASVRTTAAHIVIPPICVGFIDRRNEPLRPHEDAAYASARGTHLPGTAPESANAQRTAFGA